jgi:hypothetical protein
MEKSGSKNFLWIIAAILLIGGVGSAVYFSQLQPSAPASKPAPAAKTEPATPAPRQIVGSALENRPMAPASAPSTPGVTETPAPLSPRAQAALEEIDTVLRDQSIETGAAAQRLVKLATDATVPDQIRNDALQHAMNLLPDEGFPSLDELLKTKSTPAELLDLVYHEIHNRDVTVQLPTALLLMERTGEEISQQARELLAFRLEQDYGDDPTAWAAPVQKAVAEAKKENAATNASN